jgi:hypothetical protein
VKKKAQSICSAMLGLLLAAVLSLINFHYRLAVRITKAPPVGDPSLASNCVHECDFAPPGKTDQSPNDLA